jgi:CRISPR/Cas system CSM-associated protein Csm2 small subunit
MKINHLLESRNYLYEGLDASSLRSIKLWENAGRKLVEYQMTADQISQLFGQVEKGATDAGGNRTMIGKGKDVATAVKTAYNDLVSKVQNSAPMKDIDTKYDQAAAKLKQATGGDAGVMKYVEKYRAFAKAHPIAQSLIYSALIAAAGISGVGAGGAAALGLFKMTDKLLQGEKFSTALGQGALAGALAFGAGQVGKALQGGDQAATAVGGPPVINPNDIVKQIQNGLITDEQSLLQALKGVDARQQQIIWKVLQNQAGAAGSNDIPAIIKAIGGGVTTTESFRRSGLSETQIRRIFYTAVRIQQLNEGAWDKVKGAAGQAAGAIASKAQTVGTNLTTKVTADKLMSAWKKAGSPTDSDAVAAIMKQAGVDDAIIASSMKAPGNQTGAAAGAFGQMANQLTPAAPVDAQAQKFIQQLVASYQALTEPEKAQLKKELQDAVTASDVGSNVVKGTMESRRRKKRSV